MRPYRPSEPRPRRGLVPSPYGSAFHIFMLYTSPAETAKYGNQAGLHRFSHSWAVFRQRY
jgi:hypothetical protein